MKDHSDAALLFSWIAERIVYVACFIFIFVGAALYGIFTPTKSTLSAWKQTAGVILSVAIIGLLIAYLISEYHWNPYGMCILAVFLGMGAQKISLWMLSPWQTSDGPEDFFDKIGKIVASFMRAYKAYRKPDDETDLPK